MDNDNIDLTLPKLDLEELKLHLKRWETKFFKSNQRKPLQKDIEQASKEIKDMYRQYGHLRKLRQHHRKQEPGEDAWNDSLNKPTGSCNVAKSFKCTSSSLTQFSAKLEANNFLLAGKSKRMSLSSRSSNVHDKISANMTKKQQDAPKQVEDLNDEECKECVIQLSFSNTHRTTNKNFNPVSKIVNPVKFLLNNRSKITSSKACFIDEEYSDFSSKKYATPKVNIEEGEKEIKLAKVNNYIDDIALTENLKKKYVDNFQSEQVDMNSGKIKIILQSIEKQKSQNPDDCSSFISERTETEFTFSPREHSQSQIKSNPLNEVKTKQLIASPLKTSDVILKKVKRKREKERLQNNEVELEEQPKKKCHLSIKVSVEEPKKNDNHVFEFSEESELKKPLLTSNRRSSPKKIKKPEHNYVKLNLKKKVFMRGKRTIKGATYKRQQWKILQKSRNGSSKGKGCFKCGQPGHWVKDCHRNKEHFQEMNSPQIEDNINIPVPTLEEAAALAGNVQIEPLQNSGHIAPSEDIRRLSPPPLYTLKVDDKLPSLAESNVLNILHKFGYESFRPGQEKAIMRILCGLSTLVVQSTGSGKSLCYQLPAYMYAQQSKCISLVISPLVSLMEDQITGLPPGVNGACLHNNMTSSQKEKVWRDIVSNQIHFLLLSPEALVEQSWSGSTLFKKLPPIAFVCIDEAHCMSEWSHNFRPSYLRLCKVLKNQFKIGCILGLTATATLQAAQSVANHLGIPDQEDAIIYNASVPSNLVLSISREKDKEKALLNLLENPPFSQCESIIVYCTRREQTERIATVLRTCLADKISAPPSNNLKKQNKKSKSKQGTKTKLVEIESYHAGLTPAQRKRVQTRFMSGALRIVVATVAFGMGLDKSDVRAIIHYNMPRSFENYIQEIGRAGRDGLLSHCHLFIQSQGEDLCELKRHIYANSVSHYELKKLIKIVFPTCKCQRLQEHIINELNDEADPKIDTKEVQTILCPHHLVAFSIDKTVEELDLKEECISTLLCYLELQYKDWLEILHHTYATCLLQFYGGVNQLKLTAQKCPPVAVGIAIAQRMDNFKMSNRLEIPVVQVASMMNWSLSTIRRELRLLEWQNTPGMAKKSGILVEFSGLAFQVKSRGDLTISQMDDILSFLDKHVQAMEKRELNQLEWLYKVFFRFSTGNYSTCNEDSKESCSNKLKEALKEYFEASTESKENNLLENDPESVNLELAFDLPRLRIDIRNFISIHHDRTFRGRSIARIFYGIDSPCYPAKVWARTSFWRSYLNVDFPLLQKIATEEILKMKF